MEYLFDVSFEGYIFMSSVADNSSDRMHIMPFHRFSDSIMIMVLYINQLADNFLADSFVYQKQQLTIKDRR